MSLRRKTLCTGIILLAGLAVPLPGQGSPPRSKPAVRPAKGEQGPGEAEKAKPQEKPTVLDTLAKETLAKWQKLELHPGRAGLRRIDCEVAVRSRGGMTGTWRATGRYRYDAGSAKTEGTLTWQEDPDDEVRSALNRRGWTAKAFSRSYQPLPLIHRLRGATVQGKTRKNGTILAITGGTHKEGSFWLFDKAGVMVGSVVGPLRQKFSYETRTIGKQTRYLPSGSRYNVEKAAGEVTVWHREVQGFLVPVKIHEIVRVQGQVLSDLTFLFRKHQVQGPESRSTTPGKAGAPKAKPAAKPATKRTAKPAAKPKTSKRK